jgi:hypothetical protein
MSSSSISSCTDCIRAKSHKLPFSNSSTVAEHPLHVVHTDVWDTNCLLTIPLFIKDTNVIIYQHNDCTFSGMHSLLKILFHFQKFPLTHQLIPLNTNSPTLSQFYLHLLLILFSLFLHHLFLLNILQHLNPLTQLYHSHPYYSCHSFNDYQVHDKQSQTKIISSSSTLHSYKTSSSFCYW